MPKVDESARGWELTLSGRFGEAVATRRKVLGLSAIQLWERTVELGYPVTRISISKIENNARVGKLDVAEVLILAVALDIPPALLLFPDYPHGQVELLPGAVTESEQAVRWLAGEEPAPRPEGGRYPTNPGVELVRQAHNRTELAQRSIETFFSVRDAASEEAASELLQAFMDKKDAAERHIEGLSAELWGPPGGG
jgi:transcriptional regulator with XRE-family HTH domain